MKTLKQSLVLVLLATSISVMGQNNEETEKPSIEVTGKAEMEVMPDEIFISITLRERQEGREKITIQKQESDLKEKLKGIGVPLDDLMLSDAHADYVKINWKKKGVVAKAEYMLKVGDALTVGKVFGELDVLKINDATISSVSHTQIIELKKQIRISAIKAAKDKADYLLAAIGEETGQALKVNEQDASYSMDGSNLNIRGARSNSSYYYIDGMKVKGSEPEQVIQFKKIKLQSAIYVKFEIK